MMKKSLISFRQVSLKYGKKEIFANFRMEIAEGDKVVVFGKSGLGKSTLLRLILGFARPDEGEIYFTNKRVEAKTIERVRKQIAYVDQDTVLGEGKVREIVKEYFSFQANQKLEFSLAKLKELMGQFELEEKLLEQEVIELSGGERQRLALVVALLLERPVMLLDEVTASLDPASKKLVIDNLLKNKELTILVVTHDQDWKNRKETKLFNFKDKQWKR